MKDKTKYLLGDIGNTYTKVVLLDKKFNIIKSQNFDSKILYKKNKAKVEVQWEKNGHQEKGIFLCPYFLNLI